MSEQMKWGQRWNINDDGVMVMSDTGSWVENAYYEYLKADNALLKAEVESLYRNGDLMLKFASANMPYPAYATLAKDWLAVKEGKQS